MFHISTKHPIQSNLEEKKYSVVSGNDINISSELTDDYKNMIGTWDNLEKDKYLKDDASFRLRRFGLFYLLPSLNELYPLPPSDYFQSEEINTYAGGVSRQFAPLQIETFKNPYLHALIHFNFSQFPIEDEKKDTSWEVDVHQFRIVGSQNEIGEPTPEGIHHDGDDFNAIHLMHRQNAKGGVNTVYDNDKTPLANTTLLNPMDTVIVWDPHVMHGVSPISPENPANPAIRDVLVIGYNHKPNLNKPKQEWTAN